MKCVFCGEKTDVKFKNRPICESCITKIVMIYADKQIIKQTADEIKNKPKDKIKEDLEAIPDEMEKEKIKNILKKNEEVVDKVFNKTLLKPFLLKIQEVND